MKKSIFIVIACAGLVFVACREEEKDTVGPSIKLEEPTEEQPFTADGQHEVHIEFDLADESGINDYKIDIHYGGDGHQHAPAQLAAAAESSPWSYQQVYTDKKGQKNAHVHVHSAVIPATAQLGDYHLGIIATDIHGNESHVYVTFELVDYPVDDPDED